MFVLMGTCLGVRNNSCGSLLMFPVVPCIKDSEGVKTCRGSFAPVGLLKV